MNPASILVVAVLSLAPSSFAAGFGVDKGGSVPSDSSDFTVSQQTQVPGATLKPGSYSIHVVDKLADRTILEVDNASGKSMATFLGLAGSGLPKSSGSGKIAYDAGTDGKNALRGFAFPKGPVLEFVYPKAEAVSLAKANGNKIPAIDPDSEGRVADPTLSKSDMQVVTLWMLSTTKVGTDGGPGIKAEKYQQQVASNHPPRPAIKELPHTASEFPLLILLGAGSLLGGAVLTARRWTIA